MSRQLRDVPAAPVTHPTALMPIHSAVVPWLPLAAVTLHLVEEFVWPGGFAEWYRRYRPERASSVTTRFLVWINVLLVVMALIAGGLGLHPRGIALWLVIASIAAFNGLFHLWATVTRRVYSPGLVTGMLVYVPLALFGFLGFWRADLVSTGTMVQALVIGPAYHVYAAWNHRRRARVAA